jgi:hypothetical protein
MTIKIVKLRKNQRLYKKGFTHAFAFDTYIDDDFGKIVKAVRKIYNDRRWRGKYYAWEVDDSGRYTESKTGRWITSIWVGVRSEQVTTQVLMIKDMIED